MTDTHSKNSERDYLAELIGEFIEYWGFKKVQGRMWAHLYLAKHPMDAAELMECLSISKALSSITLSTLLEYKVIEHDGKSPHGTRMYRANPKPSEAILQVLRVREKRLLAKIEAAHRLANELDPEERKQLGMDPDRLKRLGSMIKGGDEILNQFLALGNPELGFFHEIDEP